LAYKREERESPNSKSMEYNPCLSVARVDDLFLSKEKPLFQVTFPQHYIYSLSYGFSSLSILLFMPKKALMPSPANGYGIRKVIG
jgi:hypothetical protein